MRVLVGLVASLWLIAGSVAADQRGYFGHGLPTTCSVASNTTLTLVAGPLNYHGVDAQVSCRLPRPSA